MTTTVRLPVAMEKIADFCRRWQIEEVSLFGSVLTNRFGDESDVDVLVAFAPGIIYTLGQLDEMQEELATIFGRPVDLIDKKAIQQSQNYIRRREILGSAQVIYAV